MKLVRYGQPGSERAGAIDSQGRIRTLSKIVTEISAEGLASGLLDRLAGIDVEDLPLAPEGMRIGPPVANVGKIMAIGLNYSDHAAEAGMELPKEPILFTKATTAICGPNDPITLPPGSEKSDWEVELAVVIGKRAKHVSEADAIGHVAGYTIMNDVSERAYQFDHAGQWIKGKSYDTFAPIGPWLVTPDEIPDPQKLRLWLNLNGQPTQAGTTANMVFGVVHLIAYLSRFMTLMPGDIITTGTPPGVGMGMKPPRFLKPGDKLHLGIDGLGEQACTVTADQA